jgi:hypothetical protein
MAMSEHAELPVPAPQAVHLKHAEVLEAAMASKSRLRGGGTWFTAILFALLCLAIWAGHVVTFWLVQQLPFAVMFAIGPYLPVLLPGMFCLFAVKLALDIEQRRVSRAYLAALAARGIPLERDGTYHVTPEALVLSTERIELAPRWAAIDHVERGARGWVLSADQLHFLIPFADFADPEAERALLAAITARMTPDARTRSREAVELAATPPVAAAEAALAPAAEAHAEAPATKPLAAPAEASGWLTQEQAAWAGNVTYAKVARPGFHGWAYPLTGAVTGLVVGLLVIGVLAFLVPSDWIMRSPALVGWFGFAVPLLGGALGLAYAHRRLGIVLAKAWRGGLVERGVPEQVEARWTLTDTGLAYHTARFSGEAAYASLHQLLHEHGYWIIAADALTLCIPDTAFASPDDANAFMAQLLSRMPEPARERSVSA